ncbi:MAG: adenosine deaminase [Candidatus Bathyarchaeia archaeon]
MASNSQIGLMSFLRSLPKVELHRHLIGSVRVKTLLDIAVENRIVLPTYELRKLRNLIEINEPAPDLHQFLSPLEILGLCFYDGETIARVSYEAVEDAAKDNVKYMELSIGPAFEASFHRLSLEEVFEGIIKGIRKAEERYNIKVNLIVGPTFKWKKLKAHAPSQVLEAALKYKEKVVGFSLSAETKEGVPFTKWPNKLKEEYISLAEKAKECGLFITSHAGEVGSAQSIMDAIKYLKADRIGHGIKSIENPKILSHLVARRTPLEICVTSNIKSGVVKSLRAHPIKQLFKQGALVTINTDDPTLCKTTLTKEYNILFKKLNFSYFELKQIILNALAASFLNTQAKECLNKIFQEVFTKLESYRTHQF